MLQARPRACTGAWVRSSERLVVLLLVALYGCLFLQLGVAHAGGLRSVEHQASGSGHHSRSGGSSNSGGGGSHRGGGGSNNTGGNSSGSRSGGGGGGGRSGSYGRYGGGSLGPNAGYNNAHNNCDSYGNCGGDGGGDSIGLAFLAYTVGLPFSLPRLFDDDRLRGYAPYPFADGPGVLRLDPDAPESQGLDVRNVALAIELESGYQLQGIVPATFAMRLFLPKRFALESRISLLSDTSEHPTVLGAASTADLSYRFAQGRRWDFRVGLGTRNFTLADMRWGIDFLYAIDAYLASNLVMRLEGHLGNADKAFVGQARVTLGLMLGPCELYAGYDHTVYHDTTAGSTGSAKLGGPIGGLRLWF